MANEPKILTQHVLTGVPWETPLTITLRSKFFLTGVFFPIICLTGVTGGMTPYLKGDMWQDGKLFTYVSLLLSAPAFLAFIPIILFSMTGLAFWSIKPETYSRYWVRLAIRTGVLLTIKFNILLWLITAFISPFAGGAFLVGQAILVWVIGLALPRLRRFTILHLLVLTGALSVLLAIGIQIPEAGEIMAAPFFIGFIAMFLGAPFMAMITFLRVSIAIRYLATTKGLTVWQERRDHEKPMLFGWLLWLPAWMASLKIAIDFTLSEYGQLPTTPPQNCFVSQAATCGHKEFVGATRNKIGQVVSMQMARCKMIEIVLSISCPALHRFIRRIYNSVGPPIARRCRRNIWLADAAYLVLKPVEWLAVIAQKALKISNHQVQQLYQVPENTGTKCG